MSKPTERVVRVLELLGTSPRTGLRFSDLAREGGLSQATCHAILSTLTEAGYVVRDPGARTYTLGPALLALGAAASEGFADVRAAHDELVELSTATRLPVSAATVVDGSITVLDAVGVEGRPAPIRVGTRVPLAPPFGAIHVAWSAPDVIAAWISRAPRDTLTPARLHAILTDHRATHLAVAPYTATSTELRGALGALAADALAPEVRERTIDLLAAIDELDRTAEEVDAADRLAVNTLTAPVFDADGRTRFAVALHLAEPEVPARRVRDLGARLRALTERLTVSSGGVVPPVPDPDRPLVPAGGAS